MNTSSVAPARQLYAAQRHERIVAEARAAGRVEVASLAEDLGVTPETVRRDLTSLERRGLVRRVHGGALPVEQTVGEPTVLEKLGQNPTRKQRIAGRAVEELTEGAVVLLDGGTTTLALARILPDDLGLTVVTNSVAIAATLLDRGLSVHVLGGRVRESTGAAVGPWALTALADAAIDVAFLGTNGFSVARGFTTPDDTEAAVKRAMVAAARRSIVLADASKAGQVQFQRFARPTDIEMLITDSRLDDETIAEFELAGTQVVTT